jgi:hypothetical protein
MCRDSLNKLVVHVEDFVRYMSRHRETLFQLEVILTTFPKITKLLLKYIGYYVLHFFCICSKCPMSV